jgi:hypothetical protein
MRIGIEKTEKLSQHHKQLPESQLGWKAENQVQMMI